jgi:hypothetical protein
MVELYVHYFLGGIAVAKTSSLPSIQRFHLGTSLPAVIHDCPRFFEELHIRRNC